MRGIVAVGEPALEPVRAYCKRADSLMWPLKVLKAIVPGEGLQEELLTLLDAYDTEYVRNVEPKVQLITELAQHKSDEVRVALEPFLQDASEPVRFTAVTSVFALGDEQSVPALIAALSNEESQRIRNRIAQRLTELRWSIPEDLRSTLQASLPEGYRLDGATVSANA